MKSHKVQEFTIAIVVLGVVFAVLFSLEYFFIDLPVNQAMENAKIVPATHISKPHLKIDITPSDQTIPATILEEIKTILPKIENHFKTDVFDLTRDFQYITVIKWGFPHMPDSSHDYEIIFSESEPSISTGENTMMLRFDFEGPNMLFSSMFNPPINYYKEKGDIAMSEWIIDWHIYSKN